MMEKVEKSMVVKYLSCGIKEEYLTVSQVSDCEIKSIDITWLFDKLFIGSVGEHIVCSVQFLFGSCHI